MKVSPSILFFAIVLMLTAFKLNAESIPAEDFAKLPNTSNLKLSPSGKSLIFTANLKGIPTVIVRSMEGDRRVLSAIDLGEYYIEDYEWANEERILVWARNTARVEGAQLWNYSRIVSVDKYGKNTVPIPMKPNREGFFRQFPRIISWIDTDKNHVLAELDNKHDSWAVPEVHKVNVVSGKRKKVQGSFKGIQAWIADKDGNIRVGKKVDQTKKTLETIYTKQDDGRWEVMQKSDALDLSRISPLRFDHQDSNVLLVESTDPENQDSTEIFRYDMTTKSLIGRYENKVVEKLKRRLKNLHPETNVVLHNQSRNRRHFIFEVYSDVQPSVYVYVNLNNYKFQPISGEYPHLQTVKHSEMKKIEYLSKGGFTIPGFLTLPSSYNENESKVPLIVFPHGGPWAHDEWGFDNYVQFFAHRGYAVLQPQFRGSTGYGVQHLEAGYGEWGGTIQDDIRIGTEHVLNQYNLDREKVCIVGASFGGYAAAMGLVQSPELYTCGISINGVMNLVKMISDARYYLSKNIDRKVWNDIQGADSNSPYHQAKHIKSPLLLIASKKDTVVPYQHSKTMYKRLKKLQSPVEYLELKEGEHWRTYEPNEVAIFKAMDKFLANHLKLN